MKAIVITWKRGKASGFSDILPVDEFERPVKSVPRIHVVRRQGSKSTYRAKCRLTVKQLSATLDYSAYNEFNEQQGMYVGALTLIFADRSRNRLSGLFWDDREQGPLDVSWKTSSVPDEVILDGLPDGKIRTVTVMQRKQQGRLRHRLELVYGGACCISGCAVPSALEAAHLQPVSAKGATSGRNALLLRADLHSLFDANQLAINPKNLSVQFSRQALDFAEYRRLQSGRLARPQAAYVKEGPDPALLKKRWRMFQG